MKAKVFLAISMIALSVTGVSAQSKIVYGGLSLPNGYFAEDEYDKNIISGGKEGAAGTGFNAGFKYLQSFSDPKLSWFVSAELLYNGLTSDFKDEAEDKLNPEDVKFESYFNIPVMAGFNYNLAALSSDVSLWIEAGLGVNCRLLSDFRAEYDDGGEIELSYDKSFLFAYQFGGGLTIKNKLMVGLAYYNLGTDKLRGQETKNNKTDKFKTKKELSATTLALRVGYIF